MDAFYIREMCGLVYSSGLCNVNTCAHIHIDRQTDVCTHGHRHTYLLQFVLMTSANQVDELSRNHEYWAHDMSITDAIEHVSMALECNNSRSHSITRHQLR